MEARDKWGIRSNKWETHVKSCRQRIECSGGGKLGDKYKIMLAKNPECSGENWEARGRQLETSVKSCGPEH